MDYAMDGDSLNLTQEKVVRLKAVIPEAFVEEKLDWEKLRAALEESNFGEFKDERYVLNWAGKSDAFRKLQEPTSATLVPCQEESLNFDNSEHLFIEGENLEVLKALQRAYFGKVKMIYIDPPYNTGNDFLYNDKFAEEREDYLERIGDKDENGFKLNSNLLRNRKENGHFHSNWLSMIYPRLCLARNLLRKDGVIFVSIDDNEAHNLRLIMNEIFGEENFVNQFIWETKKAGQGMTTQNMIVVNHEHILVYAKFKENFKYLGLQRDPSNFKNPDNDPRGPWKRQYLQRLGQGLAARSIINPCTKKKYTFETPYTQEKLDRWIIEDRIIFPKNDDSYPARKEFLNEYENSQQLITSLGLYATKSTTEKLYALFDKLKIFTNPKPYTLLRFLLQTTVKDNDIILDFFAGSATTAHAVLDLNREDGGNRKFIMVQLPEPCDEKSEAYKAGYKTIADIGKERIRRVIQKIKDEKDEEQEKLDLDGTNGQQDLGFKVFKLQESNFKQWQTKVKDTEQLSKQLKLHVDPLKKGSKTENILYELLLKSGIALTAKIEKKGKTYSINNDQLVLFLESIDSESIKLAIAAQPQKVIALDRLFQGEDQLKTNTDLQMKDAEIEFETV